MYFNKKNIKFLNKGLSIIIPVYNGYEYLPRLFETVKQTNTTSNTAQPAVDQIGNVTGF